MSQLEQIPWAVQRLKCSSDLYGECKRYNGTCWIDRGTDYQWQGVDLSFNETQLVEQRPHPRGRAGWHPDFREHQIQGRSLAFPVLKALHEIFTEWQQAEDFQLPDEACLT